MKLLTLMIYNQNLRVGPNYLITGLPMSAFIMLKTGHGRRSMCC